MSDEGRPREQGPGASTAHVGPTAGERPPATDPPPYPGWGAPGWHGPGPAQSGRPGPAQAGRPGPLPQPWLPYARPPVRSTTPWPALIVVSLVVGLVGGVLGTVAALAGSDDPAPDGGSSRIATDPAPLPASNTDVAAVADTLLPSVVQVTVRSGSRGATGSGFVLDDDGHVVTNAHVVRAAAQGGQTSVVLSSGGERPAELVGYSEAYDLAVLKVEPTGLTPARLGSSRRLQVGQSVVAFGSPLGLTSTVTSGIVSALDRPVTAGGSGEASYINAVQTDAAINPGNSGGPLVDLTGRVVGVNSAIATVGGALGGQAGNIGVGFAIPIDQVRVTAAQLIRTGRAVYPIIGADLQTGEGRSAEISSVRRDSPAERAGLEKGDVVVGIDGRPVQDGIELIVEIRSQEPGDTVTLEYVRDGERETTDVVLGRQVG